MTELERREIKNIRKKKIKILIRLGERKPAQAHEK